MALQVVSAAAMLQSDDDKEVPADVANLEAYKKALLQAPLKPATTQISQEVLRQVKKKNEELLLSSVDRYARGGESFLLLPPPSYLLLS